MKILAHSSHVGDTGYNAHSQGFFRELSKRADLKIRNFTVGKNWRGYVGRCCHDEDANDVDKKLLYSQTLFSGNDRADHPIYAHDPNFAPDVNIVLNTVGHYYFYDEYVGPKIAYTVWENTLYPQHFFEQLKKFDQIWVPSAWQRDITIAQGADRRKVKIVHEGVDGAAYCPKDVHYDDDKFRFLVFGAWSSRKSTLEIVRAFVRVFGGNPEVELVLSANNPFLDDGLKTTRERLNYYNIRADNVRVVDFPDREEYISYLQKGHVFVSCARGEGWNIPLLEAMACGTPSIYSDCGAQLEFAQGNGIPVRVLGNVEAKNFLENKSKDSPGCWFEPDYDDLGEKMLEVYKNYFFYKRKALSERDGIVSKFTWQNAATSALSHIAELNKLNILASCSYVGGGGFNNLAQNFLPALNRYHNVKVRNFTVGANWNGYSQHPHDQDVTEQDKQLLVAQTLFHADGKRDDYPIYNYSPLEPDLNLVINEVNHLYFYDEYKGPKIGFSMYETTEFPQNFFERMYDYDQFWVPTVWQRNNLIEQGFPKDKLRIVPLGVDAELFNPNGKTLNNKFTFVMFGRWDQRKSVIDVLRAFKGVFGDNDSVQLLLGADNPHDIDGLGSVEKRLEHYNLQSPNIKALRFLSKQDYVATLKSAHVFLSCSRGEGWNLPLIEAMACGVPSIYSSCSGQLEFARNLGIPVKIKMLRRAKDFKGQQFCNDDVGYYSEPDFEHLKQQMINVYNDYDVFAKKASEESEVVRSKFSWENSADIANEHIKQIFLKKIEFVKFTENNRGIEYKNVSNKDLNVVVEFVDSVSRQVLFKDNLTLKSGVQYFSSLNDSAELTNSIVFFVKEVGGAVLLQQTAAPSNAEEKVQYHVTLKNNFVLPELEFFYNKKTNTLRFRSVAGDSEKCVFIAKELASGLPLSSINNRDLFYIKEGWNYFVYVSKEHVLTPELFSGFELCGYEDGELVFAIEIPIFKGGHRKRIHFGGKDLLELNDNFFAQSLEFYSRDLYSKAVQKEDIIVDVGASCGTFTDFCLARGAARIIAVEPSRSATVLKDNFSKDVEIFVGALSTKTGTLNLKSCADSTLTSVDMEAQKSVDVHNNIRECFDITVQSISFADLIKKYNLSRIDLLKMDIEGHEYDVFDSIRDSDLNIVQSFLIEYHHNKGNKVLDSIVAKLKQNGYSVCGYSLTCEPDDSFEKDKGIVFATKRIFVVNESPALGDAIAWAGEVERFADIYSRSVVYYYTPFKDLFDKYKNVVFRDYPSKPSCPDRVLGCFDPDEKTKWNELPLQELASRLLKIPKTHEQRPKIKTFGSVRKNKYVCIAVQSTAQAKYWNNAGGWQKTVDYLKSLGYDIVCLDKHSSYGIEGYINDAPKGCALLGKDNSLTAAIQYLSGCEFFIGLSSGLSWLAWALGKPVVMISGYTNPKTEFYTPYRVYNNKVCCGCWNDPNAGKFDPSNWLWCPRNKNFECSKEITFEMVKHKIDRLLKI